MAETITSDTLVSIQIGEAAERAGDAGLCNKMVLSTVPSMRHGSCGPRGSTVHPGMLTETQAFPRMLPESDRSVPLAGQLTCKLCLGPHPERLSDELVPEKSNYETQAGQNYPHIKDDLAQCVQLMVIRGRSSK